MLIENTLMGEVNKVEVAIQRLREFEPPEGYYLAFSGGKDSQTVYHLAKMAGVKFDAHFNLTTVDPPELIYFIRENYPDIEVHRPEKTMWQLIPKKLLPPNRMIRYCCDVLKERGGDGRVVLTGVRWAESAKRSKRRLTEACYKNSSKVYVNCIIDWGDADVWEFLNDVANVPHCKLYDEGFTRIGCVGCPMSTPEHMKREFERYPKIEAAYIAAFDRMIAERIRRGKKTEWKDGREVMAWWLMEQRKVSVEEGQMMLLE